MAYVSGQIDRRKSNTGPRSTAALDRLVAQAALAISLAFIVVLIVAL